jgi:hypothetical protein
VLSDADARAKPPVHLGVITMAGRISLVLQGAVGGALTNAFGQCYVSHVDKEVSDGTALEGPGDEPSAEALACCWDGLCRGRRGGGRAPTKTTQATSRTLVNGCGSLLTWRLAAEIGVGNPQALG